MKKRMLDYLAYMDGILDKLEAGQPIDNPQSPRRGCETPEQKPDESTLAQIYENHMNQITFFMHERLIHLIVTVLFAIGTFMTVFTFLIVDNIGLLALAFLLIVLLVPYIKHYYLLENGVQKMYEQYDRLRKYIGWMV